MKKQLRYGFTLVELLVVISIIGMLAGLLLPAVQAAREAGRRATCISNQSNVALALLNYDAARGHLPAMKKEIYDAGAGKETRASWVGLILPYIELNQAWEVLSRGQTIATSATGTGGGNSYQLRVLAIPVLKCKSSNVDTTDTKMSYVVNGGMQNAVAVSTWGTLDPADPGATPPATVGGATDYLEPSRKADSVFFDHTVYKVVDNAGTPVKNTTLCTETNSIDYISSNSGTTQVILLSENLDAGNWITVSASNYATSQGEEYIAFCYPMPKKVTLENWANYTGIQSLVTEATSGNESWDALDTNTVALDGAGTATGSRQTSIFINLARTGYDGMKQYRKARPSSNHPGIVVAAFADRSVRTLNENINKEIYVRICQPRSGVIVNPKDL